MRLKDLVVSSFRVQRRKKKTAPSGPSPLPEVTIGRYGSEKNKSWFSSLGSRGASRDVSFENEELESPKWQGNELYRGLIAASAAGVNAKLAEPKSGSDYRDGDCLSAEGFSSELTVTSSSNSYTSQKTVTDYQEFSFTMSSKFETSNETCATKYRCCHCHNRRSHHHHHNNTHRSRAMSTISQNQQNLSPKTGCMKHFHSFKTQEAPKSEVGFFRKSIASIKSMRKHGKTSNSHAPRETQGEQMRCSLCPGPESTAHAAERTALESRQAKTKKKGFKRFSSKFKEKKENPVSSDCYNKLYFLDNEVSCPLHAAIDRKDIPVSKCPASERSLVRECSLESRSSGLYDSLENSSMGDADISGFDSASLSGYDSDLSRSKVHRPRSRIKTNPWLPSPQPSLSEGRCRRMCGLRESKEEEYGELFRSSACFEHQGSTELPAQTTAWRASSGDGGIYLCQRSCAAIVDQTSLAENPSFTKKPRVRKWPGRARPNFTVNSRSLALNDLNTEYTKPRQPTMASPNVEFVKLADNLKQLASNISAEYDAALDTALTSVAIGKEGGQTAVEDKNGSTEKWFLKSDCRVLFSHSPDSGIGGAGSTDGDVTLTPGTQAEMAFLSMDCSPSSASQRTLGGAAGRGSKHAFYAHVAGYRNESSTTSTASKSSGSEYADTRLASAVSSPSGCHKQDRYTEDTDPGAGTTATAGESVHNNAPYQDCVEGVVAEHENAYQLGKLQETDIGTAKKKPTLMVNERLDIEFQPPYITLCGPNIETVTGYKAHERLTYFGSLSKQTTERAHWSSDALSYRAPRPRDLKYKPYSQGTSKKMKNLEKISRSVEQERSVFTDSDYPWNITVSDCVESPTENVDCTGQFPSVSGQDTIVTNQELQQIVARKHGSGHDEKSGGDSRYIQNEALVVRLYDSPAAMTSRATEVVRDNIDTANHTFNYMETRYCDNNLEMVDACVQTDFDDDYDSWDELDCLEESATDPAENARFWLQSGNMLGSADIGFSDRIPKGVLFLEEDSERLPSAESSHSSNHVVTPRHSVDFDADLYDAIFWDTPQAHDEPVLDNSNHVSNACGETLSSADSLSINRHHHFQTLGEAASHPLTAMTPSTENLLFSDIELQFEEIFQEIQEHDSRDASSKSHRRCMDTSDSAEEFSGSDDLDADVLPKASRVSLKLNSFKTDETKEGTAAHFNIANRNLRSLDMSPSHFEEGVSQTNAMFVDDDITALHKDVNRNILSQLMKPERQRKSISHSDISKTHLTNFSSEHRIRTQGSSKAGYQSPAVAKANRPGLERSVCLMTDLNLVEESCFDQVSAAVEKTSPSANDKPLYSSFSNSSLSLSQQVPGVRYGKFTRKDEEFHTNYRCSSFAPQILGTNSPNSTISCMQLDCPHNPVTSSNNNIMNTTSSTASADYLGISNKVPQQMQQENILGLTLSEPSPLNFALTTSAPNHSALVNDEIEEDGVHSRLAERVMSLRRAKDLVFLKIQQAQEEETSRQAQRREIQQNLYAHRKAALLDALQDLKNRLEERSRRLVQTNSCTGGVFDL